MHIAFPTEDGNTICRHFGRAPYYTVISVEDNRETGRELRRRGGQRLHEPGHDHDHDHHGHDHAPMFAAIRDCQVLIAGGMGHPARDAAEAAGLEVVLTLEQQIDQALQDYLAGSLEHNPRLAHKPGGHHH